MPSDFLTDHELELVTFKKGQRKDEVFQPLRSFKAAAGVVFGAVAQEKAWVKQYWKEGSALFYSRVSGRVIRPGHSLLGRPPDPNTKLGRTLQTLQRELEALIKLQPAAKAAA